MALGFIYKNNNIKEPEGGIKMDNNGNYTEEGYGASLVAKEENSGKKDVFLIGDSIRMGYCGYTAEALKDIVNVKYPNENCRFVQYTYVSLGHWAAMFENPENVAVIYWNNGHWDSAHWDGAEDSLNSIPIYCEMLGKITKRLKKYFPNAKIIFATTTPPNPNGIQGVNKRTRAEVVEYNKAAVKHFENSDVEIDDVFELLQDWDESLYSDYCHLTEEGYKTLGEHVAQTIRKYI